MADIDSVFNVDYLSSLSAQLDNRAFQSNFNAADDVDENELVHLKLGAMLGFDAWVNGTGSAAPPTSSSFESDPADPSYRLFDQWLTYIVAAIPTRRIELRDLFLMSAAALWARRPTELRHVLRSEPLAEIVDNFSDEAQHPWPGRVQNTVSRALVLVARQSGRDDVKNASLRIEELRDLQKTVEANWIKENSQCELSALSLLSLYHSAQATIVLTDYILEGTYINKLGKPLNVGNELATLLRKSQEYADLTSDPELTTWTRAVSVFIDRLRSDSIWANGYNINQKIDSLVQSASKRDNAILSMLPSQQEALARNLLDAQREAVVLQMPTSSGKTLMAELAILHTLSSYAGARVVYVTPTRALATQVRRTLGADFGELGIEVTAAGSAFEEDPFELAILRASEGVIVSTPEKLDLLLRAHPGWFESVRLIIVDEAHLLKDGERGARLELLLANIRREHSHARLLLLTPFVENAQEIASWLSQDRGREVSVRWRPARLIIGLATLKGSGANRSLDIEWKEPHRHSVLTDTSIRLSEMERNDLRASSSALTKVVALSRRLRSIGPSLAMFPSSRVYAEKAALQMAAEKPEIDSANAPAELRVALALASNEYGDNSDLAACLRKGVAFHHSALSGELRFLVERLAAMGTLDFIAATTTLAQGMNFPVSSVVVHSVNKPRAGSLTPGEFWNIAGRAGRVGLSERGIIVFANSNHRSHWERYTRYLSDTIESSMTEAVGRIRDEYSVKWIYKTNESLRPFIQYIGHSVARLGANATASDLERLVTASFAGKTDHVGAALIRLARRYLAEVAGKGQSYMKVADQTGLASFSFDELYASILGDPVLSTGDIGALREPVGLKHLIDALAKLPELSLALDQGHGHIDTEAVANVVHKWINGATISVISEEFRGEDEADRVRAAGKYVFGQVSQTVSWGAHAYLRGRDMFSGETQQLSDESRMLPAYIQYGVNTPASVLASILGVPRQLASRIAALYDERHGTLALTDGQKFKGFLEAGTVEMWKEAVDGTGLASLVSAEDLRMVWRNSQGLGGEHSSAAVA
jgi:hypothetical protein